MIHLSIAEAFVWFLAFLLTAALNWWVSTPPLVRSKPGWFPGFPSTHGSNEPDVSVPRKSVWQESEESVVETRRDSEFADPLFDSA